MYFLGSQSIVFSLNTENGKCSVAFSFMMILMGRRKAGQKHLSRDSPKESNTIVMTQVLQPDGCEMELQKSLLLAEIKEVFYFLKASFCFLLGRDNNSIYFHNGSLSHN